jgi:hypothetical protein
LSDLGLEVLGFLLLLVEVLHPSIHSSNQSTSQLAIGSWQITTSTIHSIIQQLSWQQAVGKPGNQRSETRSQRSEITFNHSSIQPFNHSTTQLVVGNWQISKSPPIKQSGFFYLFLQLNFL